MARIEGADDGESLSLTLPHTLRQGGTVAARSRAQGSALPTHPVA
jgi:hypothetical protein